MYNNTCKTIGVLSHDFSHPQTAMLLQEVNRQLNARGCAALLIDAAAEERARQLAPLLSAALHLSGRFSDAFRAAAGPIPLVALDTLNQDGFTAGEEMGRLLLAQGHQRFGYLQLASCADPARLDGFGSVLAAADKPLGHSLIACDTGDERDSGYQAMLAYLKRARASERIQALFCDSDRLAFGALQAVRDFGQGAHVAVVGFGDCHEAGTSTWHLTSWAQPHALRITEALNRLLLNRAQEDGAWRRGELRVRHSHQGKAALGEMGQCGCAIRH
ncbi:substrate-binding domain-containing protein [Pantoea tagorei]|uniref:substrate-binding domain-containing protein n=1 Tax=Pantoea TaxID=53335 RepID=UPI000CDE4B7B|nr:MULTISPECIES: substrate-binding domain-containing protein [Pantoea]MCG7368608.1 substrate-binding domain-containing protein [Pantoea sp. ACRSH]MCG7397560.1 substrate-binding domain-containing protein [Pantoea sp. ACRSC]POW56643.1 LacI family transcriptional regulator [Pantoea alvi]UBN55917.1 substrate-binding domain-containing protein [Pantoea agglomerans]